MGRGSLNERLRQYSMVFIFVVFELQIFETGSDHIVSLFVSFNLIHSLELDSWQRTVRQTSTPSD